MRDRWLDPLVSLWEENKGAANKTRTYWSGWTTTATCRRSWNGNGTLARGRSGWCTTKSGEHRLRLCFRDDDTIVDHQAVLGHACKDTYVKPTTCWPSSTAMPCI